MADQLKPQFFVIRHNGSMVPLVAMDELPQTLLVRGVPRLLNPRNLAGMTCVGNFDSRHSVYAVENLNQSPNSQLGAELRSGANHIRESVPIQNDTSADAPSEPDSQLPVPGRKEYCSHWIKRGECDFTQQGCIFKHEMPTDLQTLNAIGFKDIPQWYRQKYGVPSLLAVQGSDAALGGIGMQRRTPAMMLSNWRVGHGNSTQDNDSKRRVGRERRTSNAFTVAEKASTPSRPSILNESLVQKDRQSKKTSTSMTERASEKTLAKEAKQKQDSRLKEPKVEQQLHRDIVGDYLSDFQESCNIASLTPEISSSSDRSSGNSRRGNDTCDASASSNGGSDDLGYETSVENHDSPASCETLPHEPYSYNEISDAESGLDIEGEIVLRDAARREKEEQAYAAMVAAEAAAKESQEPPKDKEGPASMPVPPSSSVSVSSNDKQGQRRRPRGRRAGRKAQARRNEGK